MAPEHFFRNKESNQPDTQSVTGLPLKSLNKGTIAADFFRLRPG